MVQADERPSQEILVVGEQTVFTLKEILLVSDDTTVSMGLRGR